MQLALVLEVTESGSEEQDKRSRKRGSRSRGSRTRRGSSRGSRSRGCKSMGRRSMGDNRMGEQEKRRRGRGSREVHGKEEKSGRQAGMEIEERNNYKERKRLNLL